MTKIKNTKKGMAKKTLSMSLVVAMLATSNVPVWAAEFSDGSEASVATEAPAAETFSDDVAEAPVVEDTTEADTTDAATVTEAGDLILDDVTITKSATFGANEKVAVSGIIKYKDGSDVKELKDYYFGWILYFVCRRESCGQSRQKSDLFYGLYYDRCDHQYYSGSAVYFWIRMGN